jgi:hypothetical protein
MGIRSKIEYEKLEKFQLDPQNPRFGRDFRDSNPLNNRIMNEMEDWKLDELAVSFLSSNGFGYKRLYLFYRGKKERVNFLLLLKVIGALPHFLNSKILLKIHL